MRRHHMLQVLSADVHIGFFERFADDGIEYPFTSLVEVPGRMGVPRPSFLLSSHRPILRHLAGVQP